MSLRVACIGGGPGGLFLGALVKKSMADADFTLFERNKSNDAFGFGVVFSDQTLTRIDAADPVLHNALAAHGVHWDSIQVWLKDQKISFDGNGMAAINRRTLLGLLQDRAAELGVDLRFSTTVTDVDALAREYDLVIAADGANSALRERFSRHLHPQAETATAKFIWFGTTYMFDGLTFVHRKSAYGNFAVHGYPISSELSTFIVETDEQTWRRAGLDEFDVNQPPGPSDEKTKAFLEELFAADIDGHHLVSNNSRWGNFRTRRTEKWHHENIVWLGDAVHTAHFSVGSGTKMAMEDAVSLAAQLVARPSDLPAALAAYEADRQPGVARIQESARPSLSWWEHFGRYYNAFEPWQFAFHFMSRSIQIEKMRQRDPDFVAATEAAWRAVHGGTDPLATPLTVGAQTLNGRTGVLAVDQESFTADDGSKILLRRADVDGGADQGLLVDAPDTEHEVVRTADAVTAALPGSAPVIVITAGTSLTRSLLSERLRLAGTAVTILALEDHDPDTALTLVLSGRADAIAYPSRGQS